MTRIVVRDTKTGRFVSKQKWDGKRYKRQHIKVKPQNEEERRQEIEGPIHEHIITFSYEATDRSFDLIVSARTEKAALGKAKQFLEADKRGNKISRSNYKGWTAIVALGPETEEEFETEYRSESETTERS